MNKMIFDIFGQLREIGILNKYPFLGADVMLSDNDISHYQLSPVDRNKYIYKILEETVILFLERNITLCLV
ncbi:MAG: hypothetical protein K0R77_889 [Chryseobacterium sp.]|jgi:hypothetical protein|uniref:hypothetical protein n=1 Tax=Chryseobacterium sp. TaxID=1871047 RepID=UPI00260CA86C|nr:hypothetical protein [Chryseobacterium sp.]MDF2551614.1 hypothetical protein [Chryseobacterium sp.]